METNHMDNNPQENKNIYFVFVMGKPATALTATRWLFHPFLFPPAFK